MRIEAAEWVEKAEGDWHTAGRELRAAEFGFSLCGVESKTLAKLRHQFSASVHFLARLFIRIARYWFDVLP